MGVGGTQDGSATCVVALGASLDGLPCAGAGGDGPAAGSSSDSAGRSVAQCEETRRRHWQLGRKTASMRLSVLQQQAVPPEIGYSLRPVRDGNSATLQLVGTLVECTDGRTECGAEMVYGCDVTPKTVS